MTFLECIEDEIFLLPKAIDEKGIINYLQTFFKDYKRIIDLISDETLAREIKQKEDNITYFFEALISSLIYYQKGNVYEAYTNFKNALAVLKPLLFPKDRGYVVKSTEIHEPFYRARVGANKLYTKKQMFHLPFSKREFVNTQRFSIPGFPCLYLSNSIYVCWEELNRPSIDQLQVSRFQQENFNLKIFDISLTPVQMKSLSITHAEYKVSSKYDYDFLAFYFLLTWPLSLICSLSVINEDAPFKHEYIFPQFLLQWIANENDIDGIKYFSVKSNPYNKDDYSKFINFVFPPKQIDNGDYCNHLIQSFKLTDPISSEILKISDPDFIFINKEWIQNVKYKVMIDDIIRLELIKGFPMPYTHTLFGKMEIFMQNLEVDFLLSAAIFSC